MKNSLSKPAGNVASRQRIIGGVLGVNVILARKWINNFLFFIRLDSLIY
jgi:hypothetical protein